LTSNCCKGLNVATTDRSLLHCIAGSSVLPDGVYQVQVHQIRGNYPFAKLSHVPFRVASSNSSLIKMRCSSRPTCCSARLPRLSRGALRLRSGWFRGYEKPHGIAESQHLCAKLRSYWTSLGAVVATSINSCTLLVRDAR
jgi:hypothetical protein